MRSLVLQQIEIFFVLTTSTRLKKQIIHFTCGVSDKNSLEMRKQRMHIHSKQNNSCHHLGCFSSQNYISYSTIVYRQNLLHKFIPKTNMFAFFSNPGQTLKRKSQHLSHIQRQVKKIFFFRFRSWSQVL